MKPIANGHSRLSKFLLSILQLFNLASSSIPTHQFNCIPRPARNDSHAVSNRHLRPRPRIQHACTGLLKEAVSTAIAASPTLAASPSASMQRCVDLHVHLCQ